MELKLLLYNLYVLSTYKSNEKPNKAELNSLMISSFGFIDSKITDKESLIIQIKNQIRNQIHFFDSSHTIEFKIGDLKTIGLSSSKITLRYVFYNEVNKIFIDVFQNKEQILTLEI